MTFYWVIFIILLIFSLFDIYTKINNRLFSLFIIVFLSVFTGIRYYVGTDWINYVEIYNESILPISQLNLKFISMEPLFYLLGSFCKQFSESYLPFFTILCFISLWTLNRTIKLFGTIGYIFPLLVYFCLFYFQFNTNIIRHGIMANLVWLGYLYFFSDQKYKGVFFVFLSCMFQTSGIFFLFQIIFLKRKYNQAHFIIMFICSILLYLTHGIKLILGRLTWLPLIGNKIDYYIHEYTIKSYGISSGMLLNMIVFVVVFHLLRHKYYCDKKIQLILNSLFLGILIGLIFNDFTVFVERFVSVFNMSLIFIYSYILIKYLSQVSNKMIISFVLIVYLALVLNDVLMTPGILQEFQFIPYQYSFNKL